MGIRKPHNDFPGGISLFAIWARSEMQIWNLVFVWILAVWNLEFASKWCALGDDFRTLVGNLVASMTQVEVPAEFSR
jgi:hypothetical protein